MIKKLILISIVIFVPIILYLCLRSHTPKFRDESGNTLKNSIADIQKVSINNTNQYIYVRGKSLDNPVLLWIDGGPGGSELGYTRKYLSELEEYYIFVRWDQRGTGKSYDAVEDFENISVNDYVQDVIHMSELLKEKFNKDKIFIVGHSWGSIIGIKAVKERPDLFHAYIGVAQQINSVENDIISYNKIIENAQKAGDTKTVSRLREMGPPPYEKNQGIKGGYPYMFSKLFNYADTANYDGTAMFKATEHNLIDKINIIRGVIKGVDIIYPQLENLDLESEITSIEVPVIFMGGSEDYTTSQKIAHRYFIDLKAPHKEFIWFEGNGHNNCYEDPDKFIKETIRLKRFSK